MLIEQKLQALDIDLQSPAAPIANYVTALRVGNLIFLSGASPLRPGKALPNGIPVEIELIAECRQV